MKTQNPWMGRARKSAGGMTATKMYGSNILRSKPLEVTNPRTEAQQTQRAFFAQLTAITNDLTPDQLRTLFPKQPAKRSRRSELSKQLAEHSATANGIKQVDLSETITIGNGSIGAFDASHINVDMDNRRFVIDWDHASANLPTDIDPLVANVVLIVFDDKKKAIRLLNTDVNVKHNEAQIDENLIGRMVDEGPSGLSAIISFAENGDDVHLRGFGSFTIRRRAEKTGRQITK